MVIGDAAGLAALLITPPGDPNRGGRGVSFSRGWTPAADNKSALPASIPPSAATLSAVVDDVTLLERARQSFSGRRVVVVGDAILDTYRLANGTSRCYAGGAAVIATHLRRLGADPQLITLVGRHHESITLQRCLAQQEVKSSALVLREALPTRTRVVHGDRITARPRLELYQPPPPETVDRVAYQLEAQAKAGDTVIFADLDTARFAPSCWSACCPPCAPGPISSRGTSAARGPACCRCGSLTC